MLQLGALTLSFSCAGEIILPLGAPALPTRSVIRLHHLHHSRTGSRVGGNGRGRTKGRVSPESVYMLLRCLSACAHAKGLLESSTQSGKSALSEQLQPRGCFISQDQSQTDKNPPPQN